MVENELRKDVNMGGRFECERGREGNGSFSNFSSSATRGSDLNVSDGAGIASGFSKCERHLLVEQQRLSSNLHLGIFPVFLASIKCLNNVLPGPYDLMSIPESRISHGFSHAS